MGGGKGRGRGSEGEGEGIEIGRRCLMRGEKRGDAHGSGCSLVPVIYQPGLKIYF